MSLNECNCAQVVPMHHRGDLILDKADGQEKMGKEEFKMTITREKMDKYRNGLQFGKNPGIGRSRWRNRLPRVVIPHAQKMGIKTVAVYLERRRTLAP